MFSKAVTLSGNNLPVFPIKRPAFYKKHAMLGYDLNAENITELYMEGEHKPDFST